MQEKTDEPTTQPTGEPPEETSAGKDAIYLKVQDLVYRKTGGENIGKSGGREIFDLVVNEIFALATRDGTMRLNGGFGSFHVRHYTAGERRLPSGQLTSFGERSKLRYEEGVVVKALVKNKGNLDEAIKVRGSRAKEEETPTPTPQRQPEAAGVELD